MVKKILLTLLSLIFLVLFVVGVGGVAGYWYFNQPVDATATAKTRFVVPKGQSVARISDRLQEAGLIRNAVFFRLYVRQTGATQQLQSGSFELSQSMTPAQIVAGLSQGTDDVWVTLLEGWRREEIAESLDALELEYISGDEFLELTEGKEGRLFPDSYLISRESTTEQVVSILENTFEKKVELGLKDEIVASGKTLDEVLIMASLLEREAKGAQQMKLVSGVLWNRIEIGMALNVDATLQYIKGYDPVLKTWWPQPLAVDKERPSPYNTYKVAGLPPAPIANPGLVAIEAALEPTPSDYIYYLHDPKGNIHFGKTLDEHNKNIQQYLR